MKMSFIIHLLFYGLRLVRLCARVRLGPTCRRIPYVYSRNNFFPVEVSLNAQLFKSVMDVIATFLLHVYNRYKNEEGYVLSEPKLQTLYDQIGGEKIEELVNAFYPKVYSDPDLIPLFQGDIKEIMRKQRMFLTQFTGGPPLYSQEYGPPAMRHRHLPFEITPTRATAWLRCMGSAFEEIGLDKHPAGPFFYERLKQVAAIMVNSEDTEEE
ncbi:globin [Bacillus freudenreichii]|nr:globin [Bacillus freudenreichii]